MRVRTKDFAFCIHAPPPLLHLFCVSYPRWMFYFISSLLLWRVRAHVVACTCACRGVVWTRAWRGVWRVRARGVACTRACRGMYACAACVHVYACMAWRLHVRGVCARVRVRVCVLYACVALRVRVHGVASTCHNKYALFQRNRS